MAHNSLLEINIAPYLKFDYWSISDISLMAVKFPDNFYNNPAEW